MNLKRQKVEEFEKILGKFKYNNLSGEEMFYVRKNIQQLADVIINFENKKSKNNKNHILIKK